MFFALFTFPSSSNNYLLNRIQNIYFVPHDEIPSHTYPVTASIFVPYDEIPSHIYPVTASIEDTEAVDEIIHVA